MDSEIIVSLLYFADVFCIELMMIFYLKMVLSGFRYITNQGDPYLTDLVKPKMIKGFIGIGFSIVLLSLNRMLKELIFGLDEYTVYLSCLPSNTRLEIFGLVTLLLVIFFGFKKYLHGMDDGQMVPEKENVIFIDYSNEHQFERMYELVKERYELKE